MSQSSVKSPSALHGYVPSGMTPEAWAKVQKDERAESSKAMGATGSNALRSTRRNALGQALGGLAGTLLPNAANAVSGGGKDFAEATIRGQKFDDQKLDNKDFSGADAVDATFKKASLRGARFFKSDCERADFTGADLTGASLENANLKDADLSGVRAEGTAFSQTILDAKSIEGADFTEAVLQPYVQKKLCTMVKDAATRDSLFCP